jgi:hypothetical protein
MTNLLNDPLAVHVAPQSSWYAIYTRFKHEKTVAQILTRKGLEISLPLYESTHHWKDRTKLVSLPLFPCNGYLKGSLDRRLDVMSTAVFHAVVSVAGQPAAIPSNEATRANFNSQSPGGTALVPQEGRSSTEYQLHGTTLQNARSGCPPNAGTKGSHRDCI